MKNKIYSVWIIAAGIAGAVLRGLSLMHGYEPETGLPIAGYLPAALLSVLTVVVMIAAVLYSKIVYAERSTWSYEELFGGIHVPAALLCMLTGIGIALCSAYGMLHLSELTAEQALQQEMELLEPNKLILIASGAAWTLGVVSGILLIFLAKEQLEGKTANSRTGLPATVVMFWGCLELIMVYHKNSGNPVLSDYSYQLLLIVAVMAAFYGMGRYLYAEKPTAVCWFAPAGIGVYLALVHAGGIWLQRLLSSSNLLWKEQLGLGERLRIYLAVFCGIYLLCQLTSSCKPQKVQKKRKIQRKTKEIA